MALERRDDHDVYCSRLPVGPVSQVNIDSAQEVGPLYKSCRLDCRENNVFEGVVPEDFIVIATTGQGMITV